MTSVPAGPDEYTEGFGGRIPGTDAGFALHVRASEGEIVLRGSAPLDAADHIAAILRQVQAEHRPAGTTFHLAADHPVDSLDPLPEAVADALGMPHHRDLLQLRRPLPVEADLPARSAAPPVHVRPFVVPRPGQPGGDADAWIRANNRAFAHHPDQGHQTRQTLRAQAHEDWFDPSGFLVADDPSRPGELSGFCWTKVHPPTDDDPQLGEIYVIGVDPAHGGEGLGAAFTLAGLDHLASKGITTAMLYVDADNAPARKLYDRLGFSAYRRRRVYTADPS